MNTITSIIRYLMVTIHDIIDEDAKCIYDYDNGTFEVNAYEISAVIYQENYFEIFQTKLLTTKEIIGLLSYLTMYFNIKVVEKQDGYMYIRGTLKDEDTI